MFRVGMHYIPHQLHPHQLAKCARTLRGQRLHLKLFRLRATLERLGRGRRMALVALALLFLLFLAGAGVRGRARGAFRAWQADELARQGLVRRLEAVPFGTRHCVVLDHRRHASHFRNTVTFATHSDVRGLHRLDRLAKTWDGAISVAVAIRGPDSVGLFGRGFASAQFAGQLAQVELRNLSPMMDKASVHLVYQRSYSSPCGSFYVDTVESEIGQDNAWPDYNVNIARNVARIGMQTPIFLSADLDEIPVKTFEKRVRDLAYNKTAGLNPSTVLVYRRFEMAESGTVPTNKAELSLLLSEGKATEFRAKLNRQAHAIPGLGEWLATKENEATPSVAKKLAFASPGWEPHFIGHNSTVPMYNVDVALGWRDQAALVYELCAAGFELQLLNDVFTLRMGPSSEMEKERMEARSHRAGFDAYLKDLNDKYNQVEQKCGSFDDHKTDDSKMNSSGRWSSGILVLVSCLVYLLVL